MNWFVLIKMTKPVNKCYICDMTDHSVNGCPLKKETEAELDVMCYRCGRKGHFVNDCYAETHVYGKSLYGCYNCGRDDHWKIVCKYDVDIYGHKIKKGLTDRLSNFVKKPNLTNFMNFF